MDFKTCALLVIHGLVFISAQLHLGKVQCYGCYNHWHFPECLSKNAEQCSPGEMCHIRYDPVHQHWTTISCTKRCDDADKVVHQSCPYGGSYIQSHDFCSICCKDDDCVGDATQNLRRTFSASNIDPARLFCPGSCYINDTGQCAKSGEYCRQGEYCYVKAKYGSKIVGYCESVNLEPACRAQMIATPCVRQPSGLYQLVVNHVVVPSRCVIGCCNDNDCLHAHFIQWPSGEVNLTTTLPASTLSSNTSPTPSLKSTIPSSTPKTTLHPQSTQASLSSSQMTASVPLSNITQRLKVDCKDQLIQGTCDTLKQQTNICRDPYSQTLCPEKCGICKAIKDANCSDTVLNNGCKDLKTNNDICQDPLAIYTCAETCGICDSVIHDILQKFQNGQMTPPPNMQG